MSSPTPSNLLTKDADPKPLYYRLKELLKHELSQQFKPHERFHSVRTLVQRHGVSTITVTRTIRELVDEGYLYARQGKGTFVSPRKPTRPVPQMLTISLPMRESFGELLLEPGGIRKDYFRGIADAAREHGAAVEFQLVPPDHVIDFFTDLIERDPPHGAIFYGWQNPNYPRLIERAIERRAPYVVFHPERCFTWEQIQQLNLHYVTTDQQDGIRQATTHLIELGHRRIAYWEHARTAFTRLAGFRQAMTTANIEVDESLVNRRVDFDASFTHALRALIDDGVTALVTASDYIAMKALRDAQVAGIDIPNQLSITGYDDNPDATKQVPALTTVAVDRYQTGRAITMALIRQFHEPDSDARDRLIMPTQLIVRQSTSPCAIRQ